MFVQAIAYENSKIEGKSCTTGPDEMAQYEPPGSEVIKNFHAQLSRA